MNDNDFELGEQLIQLEDPRTERISRSQYSTWDSMGLQLTENGYPRINEHNAFLILEHHPQLTKIAWYDDFHKKILTTWDNDKGREWTDADDTRLLRFFQGTLGLHNFKCNQVRAAFQEWVQTRVSNEPRQWMEKLEWDGEERLPMFMSDCMGANEDEYVQAVSQNFWIAMVARIFEPGCKYDNMIVLIGAQGTFKSTSLSIIGGNWFAAVHESVQNKDFFLALQGKLLIEIAELDSFSRAETTRVKAITSEPCDRFRAPYERATKSHPRSCVFVGTTNEEQFLQDATGGRRFWPIRVRQIRLDLIRDNRVQYFAEAVTKYKQGVTWHEVPLELARAEQEARHIADEWEYVIYQHLERQCIDQITTTEILSEIIKMDLDRQGKFEQARISRAMRRIGWERKQVITGSDKGHWCWGKK